MAELKNYTQELHYQIIIAKILHKTFATLVSSCEQNLQISASHLVDEAHVVAELLQVLHVAVADLANHERRLAVLWETISIK